MQNIKHRIWWQRIWNPGAIALQLLCVAGSVLAQAGPDMANGETPATARAADAVLDVVADPTGKALELSRALASTNTRLDYQAQSLDFAELLASLSPAPIGAKARRGEGDQRWQKLDVTESLLVNNGTGAALPLDLRYVGGEPGGLAALASFKPLAPAGTTSVWVAPLSVTPVSVTPVSVAPVSVEAVSLGQAALAPATALHGPGPIIGEQEGGRQSQSFPPGLARTLLLDAPDEADHAVGAKSPPLHKALVAKLNQEQVALTHAQQQIVRLSLDHQAIRRQLSASEQERQRLHEDLAQKQARIDLELLPELQATRDGLLKLGEDHSQLLANQGALQHALATAKHRIEQELEPELERLKAREGTQVATLFDDLDQLRFERDTAMMRAQMVDQAYQRVSSQLNHDLAPKIAALRIQLASIGGERDALSQQVQSLNEDIKARYQPMLQDLERENIDLQNRNTKLANRIEDLEQSLEASRRRAKFGQGRIDPAACLGFVDQQADMLAAMGGLQQLFQLEQVTPKDLRPIDEGAARDEGVSAFDFVFNDLVAGWLLERRVDPFESMDQQKLALLKGKKRKARWTLQSSEQVLALQAASNAWLKKKGLTLRSLGIPAAKGCRGRLCLTGLVDARTRMVAGYIFDRDPSVYPGAAVALSKSQGSEDAAERVRARRQLHVGLGSDVVSRLRAACRGDG